MESHKTCMRYINSAGFTLIEALIVLGIMAVLAGLSLFIDVNSYRGDAFRAQRNALVVALQTARADSFNNIHQQSHGVAIHPANHPQSYVIFSGLDYASSDPDLQNVIDETYPTHIDPSFPSEIVFSQLSGNANYEGDIIMIDPQRNITLTIFINHEGRISW